MKTLILATSNMGKLREVREIFPDVQVLSLKDLDIHPEIIEDGETFEENALIKVRTVASVMPESLAHALIMADDSGIEIDALGGGPGVHSSRYLGEDTPYSYKNQVILDALKESGDGERGARYVCAIAVRLPDGTEKVLRDQVDGEIASVPAGEGGFGYDPIFYVPSYGRTMAELTPDEKNAISHRGRALRRMKACLIDGRYW